MEPLAIRAATAPPPNGPYSHAIQVGGFLFCSGQVGASVATGALIEGGVEAQTRKSIDNIAAILQSAGVTLSAVVKTTIFLVDINDLSAVNSIYAERIGSPPPARSTVAVAALPRGARVEIEAIARAAH